MSYALSIVHLSDLHFGEGSRFKDRDPGELGAQLNETLTAAMTKRFGVEHPDIVVATGDLTQRASIEEFSQALTFFKSLQEKLTIPRSSFIFLPGNHDVSWDACKTYFEANPDKTGLPYDPDLEHKKLELFNAFKSEFYGAESPKAEALERGSVLYTYADLGLCIVALNSCEQETNTKHLGVVSREQARLVMEWFRNNTEFKDFIKILALHHPVNALPDKAMLYLDELQKNDKITNDMLERFRADALSIKGNSFLNAIMEDCHIHLLLHGHQHAFDEPHQRKWRESSEGHCQICPAGCFGIKPDGLLENQPSCLNVIYLKEKNVHLEMKKIFLEYDPMKRILGSLDPGCFRDTGRDPSEAVFPLSSALQYLKKPGKSTAQLNSFVEWIRSKIETLLSADADFCRAMSVCIGEANAAESLSAALVHRQFINVWSNIAGENLHKYQKHSSAFQEVLFLLAQAECDAILVDQIREQLKKGERLNVFRLNTRYIEMGEFILAAALQQRVHVKKGSSTSSLETERMINLCNFDLGETGFDSEKMRIETLNHLLKKFKDNAQWNTTEKARMTDLEQSLTAYFLSKEPFSVAHFGEKPLNIPYMVEFLIPHQTTEEDKVTQCGDALLYRLIGIVLEKTGDKTNGGV
jgi:hypothetical protein